MAQGEQNINPEYFKKFIELKESGQRAQAESYILRFIESFQSFEEKVAWTREYLESRQYGHKIRHELYREIVFPVLYEGYKRRDPWAYYWLAETIQNVYNSDQLHRLLDHKTGFELLRECFALDGSDNQVRKALLEQSINDLRYAIHEWPVGLLLAPDEILEELEYARQLDIERKFSSFFDHVSALLREDAQRGA